MNQRESGPQSGKDAADIIEPIKFRPASVAPPLPRFKLPWANALVALVVVVGAWAAWYVVTARSVSILTEPAGASVTADELIAPIIGDRWVLRPGPRRFIVDAEGYKRFADDIVVTDEPIQEHEVVLSPLPGKLKVEVTPVESATVTIDDHISAEAPTTIGNIESGPREVVVSADRYIPFKTVVEIEGRGIEQTLAVALQPAWADVSIRTQPAGATVFVDKELAGTTPFTSELMQGQRTISLTLDGYKPWQRTLKIVAGESLTLPPVLLAQADGLISVTTNPSGASVTVDKLYKGRSPLKVSVAPGKKHSVAILKEGYSPASRSVTVTSGDTETVSVELQPELAQVQVISTPEGAELYIDGKSRGSANQMIKLPTHEHELEIRKPGYVTYSATVTPRKGIRKRIKVRLKTPDEATASKSTSPPVAGAAGKNGKSMVKTALGQELKLFRGGRVKMGSSRREAGRRANEVLREANLVRPFYFGVKEVTNGEFRQFLANHGVSPVNGVDVNGDRHPVINVSWERAAMFCNWLSRKDSLPTFYQIKSGRVLGVNPAAIGYRLPTEAEWAWVARTAPNSEESFAYPWAGKYPPRGRSGNYADQSASAFLGNVIADYTDGFPVTAPVGSFLASLRGIHDIGGNVSEWINDYYVAAPSGAVEQDPLGPRQGESHVVRGSNWAHASATELRLAYRDFGKEARDDVGFRVARYAQ